MKIVICLIAALIISGAAVSKAPSQEAVVLSKEIGPVIDGQENDRFHIINQDIGLIGAKIYSRDKTRWVLHLIGKKDGLPWMLVKNLSEVRKRKLQTRIKNGIRKAKQGNYPHFSRPVITIKLPQEFYTGSPIKLTLEDNTQLLGQITNCTPDTIEFKTISEIKMDIPEHKIIEANWPRGNIVDGEFRRYDPNYVRLFFGPTGRTLRQGEVNFSDFYIFFPTLSVGMTDFFMLGGGISLLPGVDSQLLYISPKLRVLHDDDIDLATGLLYMGVPDQGDLSAAYVALTHGTPLSGFTLGLGLPIDNDDTDVDFGFLFGGEVQVSNSAKLITENWLLTGGDDESLLLVSGGVRFIGESLTVGFGLATSPEAFDEDVGFPFLPWLDFSLSMAK
ncbi:hypothetical protein GWO43_02210 [candidate division KSB1 bacterium]|nr:hypothetical protein [candidate division KSB1 bacterium]NIR69655.1 hypothetical protein [candidate division KSB1 bacterium]NIS22884.1 hypothetical protein [candidate division KSB1 bacterium]NIT69723.1 hypothetical protein [candidate division KSB1 bacterium]NIU23390.1 hypothetical protein [candidate division KSB1 bacterium]